MLLFNPYLDQMSEWVGIAWAEGETTFKQL